MRPRCCLNNLLRNVAANLAAMTVHGIPHRLSSEGGLIRTRMGNGKPTLLAIHHALQALVIFNDNDNLGIPVASLRSIVEVGRTDNDLSVVNDQELGVDVQLFRDKRLLLCLLRSSEPRFVEHTPTALKSVASDRASNVAQLGGSRCFPFGDDVLGFSDGSWNVNSLDVDFAFIVFA